VNRAELDEILALVEWLLTYRPVTS